MYACKQCEYRTDVKCNWIRHHQRKKPCVGTFVTIDAPAPDLRDNVIRNELFKQVDDKNFECIKCQKRICAKFKRHTNNCKGVPVNTCIFCKKQFNHQSAHSRHQKTCKSRPVVLKSRPTVKIATTNNSETTHATTNNSETAQATTIDGTERNYDNTGFVYLIQPGTCEGTRRFKVGFSAARHLKRVTKGYPKNSTIFCINGGITNPRELETHILREFRTRFELSKCGNEYFEGNIGDMLDVFHETVLKYRVF